MQEAKCALAGTSMSADGKTLIKDGVSYQVGDQVYVHPETFDQLEQAAQAEVPDYAAKGRFHKVGSTVLIKRLVSWASRQQGFSSLMSCNVVYSAILCLLHCWIHVKFPMPFARTSNLTGTTNEPF